jgi:peptide/nickel transport system substrate-binding protein
VAAAVPPKPLTQEEAILQYPEGQPLVPGGLPFFPRKLLAQKGYQLHIKYHQTKLPLWTKATYGGEIRGPNTSIWTTNYNSLDILVLSRVITHGMLFTIDMGLCSLVGREGKFDTCNGQYAHNYDITIIPSMFTGWQQPNPTTYVFTLRKGILWPQHPLMKRTDREVTAEDIAWYLGIVKKEGALKDNFNLVGKFEAVDRYTVRITMTAPHVEFLRHMANTAMGVIAPECYADKDCRSGQFTISPAPFVLNEKESIFRQKFVSDRNPEFYLKGLPYLDRMTGLNIPDPAAQKAAILTGNLDQWYLSRPEEVENFLKQRPEAWVHSSWVLAGNTVGRPQLTGPLADVRVRRALAMGMDLASVWEGVYSGHTTFPNLVSRDTFGAEFYYTLEQAGPWYQYNPEKAKQLLAEAGYPNGFSMKMTLGGAGGVVFGASADLFTVLQGNWKKSLNVDLQSKVVDPVSYNNALYTGTWEGIIHQTGWNLAFWADQEGGLIHMTKGQRLNLSKIDDPWISEQYLKQRSEADPAKRAALLAEFERYELDNVYFLRFQVLTSFDIGQPWEMNGASHQVTWYGVYNSPTWLSMFDPSKAPKR